MSHALPLGKRIAVLLLSIDRDVAAEVLRHLADDCLEEVARAMKELQEDSVEPGTVEEIYEEFLWRMHSDGVVLGDVDARSDDVLSRALGADRGGELSRRANSEIRARRPFALFETFAAKDVASLLSEEHPQIVAVFLANLSPATAGAVLAALPAERRFDLVRRVATLDRTSTDVVQRVLDVMRQKARDLGLTMARSEPQSWISTAAGILNSMGAGGGEILDRIETQDARLAGWIRDEMFAFDDVALLDSRSMQRVLGQVDTRVVAMALKAATPAVEQNVLRNLSRRAGGMVLEERDELGPTPISEVVAARREILDVVRKLIESGEVQIGAVPEEFV